MVSKNLMNFRNSKMIFVKNNVEDIKELFRSYGFEVVSVERNNSPRGMNSFTISFYDTYKKPRRSFVDTFVQLFEVRADLIVDRLEVITKTAKKSDDYYCLNEE